MSAIADLTCADLAAAYRRGALSPLDVARDCLARIAATAAINAFLPIEPAAVLQAATESEARWRRAMPRGPIDGVPASIKDNIWVMGLPTRRGSKTSDASPAPADSPAVARLREQGAVILGKTCMPEHGWIGVCHSPLTGITRNPWNPEYTPGGSTGGWGGGRVARPRRAAFGNGWRRLAAHPGRLHRRIRHEAELRAGAGLSGAAAQRALAPGTDHSHGRRWCADAVGDRAAGCARHDCLEYAGAGFHRRSRCRCARLARRAVAAARSFHGPRPGDRGGLAPGGARCKRGGLSSRRPIRRSSERPI